jgi:hypothetical protein
MQLSAVFLARVLFFVEAIDLNPRGTAYYPALVRALVERYGFQKFPQKPEEFDESKGMTFEQGRFEDVTLDKLVIYDNGLQLDTTRGTDASEAILTDALVWASQTLGLVYKPEMVKRKGYVSQFSFYSEAPLLQTNPILNDLSGKVSKIASQNLKFPISFQPSAILISQDPEGQRLPASAFSIERRAQTPFSEKKYFSAAPLPTDAHLRLVEEYEQSILAQKA